MDNDDYTPQWIHDWCELHDGGWFAAMPLSETHPLVAEKHTCFDCGEGFRPTDVALILPFHSGRVWQFHHNTCMAVHLFNEATRATLRPENYAELTPEDQWRIDKQLGILDWSPK